MLQPERVRQEIPVLNLDDVPQPVEEVSGDAFSIQPEELRGKNKRLVGEPNEQWYFKRTFCRTSGSLLCKPQQKVRSTRLKTSVPNSSPCTL